MFWRQTLTAFARHPGIVLLYAAPVATERAWLMLRTKADPAWWLPSLEALSVIWRLMMCAVAVWLVLTPSQWATMKASLTDNALLQTKLDGLGETVGRQLWLLMWEVVLFVAAFALLIWMVSIMARLWVRDLEMDAEQKKHQRMAVGAVARNLFLFPLALIYVAVAIRHILTGA